MSSQGYGKMQRAKNSFVPRDNPYLRPKNGTTFISQLGSSVKGFVASFFTYTPKEEVPQEQYHREEKPVAQEPKDKVINILQNTPQLSHTQYEQITKLLQEKVSESPQNIPPAVSTNTMQTAIPKNIVQTSPSNHKPAIPAQPTSAPLKPVPIHAKTVTPIDIVGRFVYKSKDGNTSPKGNGQLGLSGLQPSYVQKPGTSFVPYVPSHSMKRGRSDIPQQQQQISPQSQRGQAYYPVEEDGTIERQPPQKQRKLAPLEYTNGGGQIRSASETAKRILQLVDNMSTPLNDARTPKFRSVLSKDPRLTSSKTPQSGGMKRLDRPPIPRYNRTVTSMNFEENAPDMPPTESLYTPSTRKPYQRPTPADSIKKPTKIAYEEEEEEPQPQLTRKTKPTRERSEPYKRATKEVCDLEEDEGIQIPGYTKTVLPFPTSNVPKFTEPVKSTSTKVDTLSSSDEDQPIPKTNGAKAKQTEEAKKTPEAPKKFQESPITTSSFTETTTGFLGFTAEKKETTAPAFPSKVEEPKKQEEEVKSFLSFAQKEPAKQEEKPKAEPEKVPAFTGFGKVEDRQLFGKTEDTLPATALSFFAKSLEKPVLEKSDDKPAVSLIPTPFTETTFGKPADSKETKEPEEKKETQPPYKFDTTAKLDKPFNMESPFQLGKPVEISKVDTDLTRTMFPLNVEPSKISEAISLGKTELKPVEVKVEFKVDAFKPIDLKPATDTKAPEIKTETKQAEVVGTTVTQESTTIPPFGTAFGTNTTGSSFGTIPPTGTSGFGFQTQAAPETDKSHETTMEMNDEKPSMPASTTPAFGSTPAPVFGGFGTSTQSSFAFGQTDSTPSTFGQNTNSSTGLFAFAAPGTTSFTSTASTNGEFVFGETPSTPAPAFGQTNPQSQSSIAFSSTPQGFGTSTPAFGSTAVPAFGNISQPAFSNTPSPAFSNSAPTFGSTPAFGNTSTPAFGNASTPAFGNASTPAFGNASTPAFGTPTPTFGSGSSFNFGANSAPAFGANSAPAFGANAAPAFGAPAQPFPTPFGSTSTPSFGAFDGTAGGFSIGTAADSGRKKLKGKRSGKK